MTHRSFNKRTGFDKKIDRLRAKGAELSILSNPNTTQEERKFALQSLKEARDQQQPPSAYVADKLYQLPNQVDQSRPSIEDEMIQQVTKAYGYDTFALGFQHISDIPWGSQPGEGRASRLLSPNELRDHVFSWRPVSKGANP